MFCISSCNKNTDMEIYQYNRFNFITEVFHENSKEKIELEEGDYIQFAVKSSPAESNYYIRKILTKKDAVNGVLMFELTSEDTSLEAYDKYQYDCSISFADGSFYTYTRGFLKILPIVGKPLIADPLESTTNYYGVDTCLL